jgi:hypothetical protein
VPTATFEECENCGQQKHLIDDLCSACTNKLWLATVEPAVLEPGQQVQFHKPGHRQHQWVGTVHSRQEVTVNTYWVYFSVNGRVVHRLCERGELVIQDE